jgi:iron-sulfur cluster assembly accessory protein
MEKTSNKNYITVTSNAINQIKKILLTEKEDSFVRILVDSGGCSGFSYKFSIDKVININDDIVLVKEKHKNIFITDKISLNYIKDSSIDWEESLTNAQFLVSNPLAKSSCGCGSSFSI